MASRRQYANWCLKLIEGDDYMVEDIFQALREDDFTNECDEWRYLDEVPKVSQQRKVKINAKPEVIKNERHLGNQ